MSIAAERVFVAYKKRFLPLVGLLSAVVAAGGMLLFLFLARQVGLLPGLLAFFAVLAASIDRLLLLGNGWLRRRVEAKLKSLGELPQHHAGRFVGLAHPCYLDHLSRRMAETDDDIGFLTIGPAGLQYRGDAISFNIAADQVEDVRLVRSPHAPWERVEVRIRDGEPFDAVIFDSRNAGSHRACRRDSRKLYQQLRAMAWIAAPAGETVRLTAPANEGERVDAR
ncbi:MAG: hypothetical protein HYU66_06955 [Armatimonadetes bacterium]|nr:hypothetical protein [Armatimonadota bacterium]